MWPWPCSKPPPTHASTRNSWTLKGKSGSVSYGGHCSFLLGPGAQGSVCALQESVSPVLCKFWWLYGGINGDLLQEGLCHTQVCCTQSPSFWAGHCWPVSLQETLKLKSIYRINVFAIKSQWNFHRNRKENPKISVEPHKTTSSQVNLEKEKQW